MLNKVILMGRLTRDPEMRATQSGVNMCRFGLAVNRSYTKQGEQEVTDFFDVVAWRTTAEFVGRYFKKGMQVAVTGRIQMRTWEDIEGKKRTNYDIVADEVFFAEAKRDNNNNGYSNDGFSQGNNSSVPNTPGFAPVDTDEDLPF